MLRRLLMSDSASGWSPAYIGPSLKAWYIADNPANSLVGGELSVLADKSGSGNPAPAYGGSSLNRALLVPAGLNGRTIWRSNTSGKLGAFSPGGASMSAGVAGITLAVVHRTNPAQGTTDLNVLRINCSAGTIARAMIGKGSYASNVIYAGGRRRDSDSFGGVNDSVDHGTKWGITIAVFDYAAARLTLSVDGTTLAMPVFQTPGVTDAGQASSHGLGHSGTGSSASAACGDYAEALMIMSALGSTERQKLEGYLAWQWGLQSNLPAGHPYKSAAP